MSSAPAPNAQDEDSRDFQNVMIGIVIGTVVLTVGLVVIAIVLAVNAGSAAPAVVVIRDVMIIVLALVAWRMAGRDPDPGAVLGLAAVPLAWHEIASVQYRLARVLTFLSPGADAQESSWQITQSVIGVGSGRVFGVGFGQGQQKLGYLPYAYSDFIFSTIGEEWGFIGVCVIVLFYAVLIGLGFRIARTASDRFGMLLATGLTAAIGVSAVVHMAVSLALVPTTGLPLPLISYGRTSLLITLASAGVLISIGRRRGTAA